MTVELVREYRATARAIVRDPARSDRDRNLALVELALAARREEGATVRRWAPRAVWEESRSYFGAGDPPPDVPTDSVERAQRQQRAKGYAVCPVCLAPLATDADFERWHHRRVDYIEALERREGAVTS